MINLNYDNTGKETQTVRTYRIRPTSVADHTRHLYTLLDRGTISPEVGADRDCVYSYEPVPCALPIGRNKDNPDVPIYTIN